MKKNVASQVVGAQMVSASDGSAFTGTATVVVTVDGGTQSASGGTGPTHEGNGFHTYLPTQAETNGDHVAFTFTGTGAIPVTVQVYTTFPQTGDSFARLGAPAGASVSADIATVDSNVDAILVDTGTTLPGVLGTPTDFGSGTSTIAANLQDIADNGTATYDRSTDSLQALRDHIADGTNLTEAGGTGDHLTAVATAASISALNDLSAAQVNAEVVDALNTDTYAEPGQGTPGATISLAAKIGYIYKAWRNRSTQNATTYSLYNDDATTVDQKATVSDDGTTADKGEVGTGP